MVHYMQSSPDLCSCCCSSTNAMYMPWPKWAYALWFGWLGVRKWRWENWDVRIERDRSAFACPVISLGNAAPSHGLLLPHHALMYANLLSIKQTTWNESAVSHFILLSIKKNWVILWNTTRCCPIQWGIEIVNYQVNMKNKQSILYVMCNCNSLNKY